MKHGSLVMRLIKVSFLIVSGLVFLFSSPAQSQFVTTLGGTSDETGGSVVQTSDGGFVVGGATRSFGAGGYDVLLVKYDFCGYPLWTKSLGGTLEEGANTVIEASDGGFVVAGATWSFGAGGEDWMLSKFSSSGNHLWTKTLGAPNQERWGRVIEASDGGLVLTGWTNSFGAGGDDLLLAKFDSSGNYLWAKTLGWSGEEHGYSVVEASDGGLVVTGYTRSVGEGGDELLLAKFDATGNHLWTKTLGASSHDHPYSVIEASDGGLVVTGWTHSWGAGGDDLLISKFDAAGNHLWTRTLGGTIHETGGSVIEASDGGLVVTGYWSGYQSPGPDSAWVLLAKFDASGTHLWTRIFGGTSWDAGGSVVEASDGGLVVTGYTNSWGAGGWDLLLAKFDSAGNTCLGEFITPTVKSVSPTTSSPSPTITSPSPTITSPSPTITTPTPTVTVVCSESIPVGSVSVWQDGDGHLWVENAFYRWDVTHGSSLIIKEGETWRDWRSVYNQNYYIVLGRNTPGIGGTQGGTLQMSDLTVVSINNDGQAATVVLTGTFSEENRQATLVFTFSGNSGVVKLQGQITDVPATPNPAGLHTSFSLVPGADVTGADDFYHYSGQATESGFPYGTWVRIPGTSFLPVDQTDYAYITNYDKNHCQGFAIITELSKTADFITDINYGIAQIFDTHHYGNWSNMCISPNVTGPFTMFFYFYETDPVVAYQPVEDLINSGIDNQPPIAELKGMFEDNAEPYLVRFLLNGCTDPDHNISYYKMDYDGDNIIDSIFTVATVEARGYQILFRYSPGHNHLEPSILLKDSYGETSEASIHIYLSDFTFGRDNYHFSNEEFSDFINSIAGSIESAVKSQIDNTFSSYPPIFRQWLCDRILFTFGFCSGMASSSCTYYTHSWLRPPLSGEVYSWEHTNPIVKSEIMRYHTFYNLWAIPRIITGSLDETLDELNTLRVKLDEDKPMVMTFPPGWHSVVATALIKNTDNEYWIMSYDNNKPDTQLATWVSYSDLQSVWKISNRYGELSRMFFLDGYLGSGLPGLYTLLVMFIDELKNLTANRRHRVTIACPVEAIIIDGSGNKLGLLNGESFNQIPEGTYEADSTAWVFEIPNTSTYTLHVYGLAEDSAFLSIYVTNDDNSMDLSTFTVPLAAGSHATISFGQGVRAIAGSADMDQDGLFETEFEVTDWSWQTNIDNMLNQGTLSGCVSSDGLGLVGITVDLYDESGTLISTRVTDAEGCYDFGTLDNGEYVVSIVTPMGYTTTSETRQIAIIGLNQRANFELSKLEIVPQQRSRGYWAHQVNVYLSGKGDAQETLLDMSSYMGLISQHFNNNLANPITVFEVPQPAIPTDSLVVLQQLLTVNRDGTMNDRAKQQLIALMLNVVSFKLHQTTPISEDSATVSQAITYCNQLITDSDPSNDEIVKDIADQINNGILVASGIIPLSTPNIMYKGIEEEIVETPNMPKEFSLSQNYPNPFNPATEICFSLPIPSNVKLEIFNIKGQKVTTLIDQHLEAGIHKIKWDGSNVATGIYFYKIQVGDFTCAKKMLLLK